jgi:hypothetical protein
MGRLMAAADAEGGEEIQHPMRIYWLAAALAGMLAAPFGAAAQDFRMQEVAALGPLVAGALAPRTILFTDHRNDELSDPATGLIRFSDWERSRPQQKQLLSLFPSYEEPNATGTENGGKTGKRRLHVYVAEARFRIDKPVGAIDLAHMITLPVIEQLDPSIKHRLISPADAIPNEDPMSPNRNPDRQWCEGGASVICIQSRYQLEGRLPLGISLVNKIRESGKKKIADFMEFQSELRLLPQGDIDQTGLAKATGIDAPVAGAIEQNIFYVNQVMQFGKFLAVLQPNPTDAKTAIGTAFIVLAVDSEMFEKKKEFENVPVLRNLVPAQVLAGNSSFNTGNSISAGLPKYSRNRIRSVAAFLEK